MPLPCNARESEIGRKPERCKQELGLRASCLQREEVNLEGASGHLRQGAESTVETLYAILNNTMHVLDLPRCWPAGRGGTSGSSGGRNSAATDGTLHAATLLQRTDALKRP